MPNNNQTIKKLAAIKKDFQKKLKALRANRNKKIQAIIDEANLKQARKDLNKN